MKKIWRLALTALFIMALRDAAKAQWINGIGFQYLTNPTNGVRVGNTNTSPPSALTVLGTEMTPATGEVFRTDAPSGTNTYWRLYHKGAEYGNFFHVDLTTEFNVNATQGRLRLLTASMVRAQLNADGLGTATGFGPFLCPDENGHC